MIINRSDSPGHCAKYGTYSLIEERLNKVVDLQLVQVSVMLLDKEVSFVHFHCLSHLAELGGPE